MFDNKLRNRVTVELTFSACCKKDSIVRDDQISGVKPGFNWALKRVSLGIRTSFSIALKLSTACKESLHATGFHVTLLDIKVIAYCHCS